MANAISLSIYRFNSIGNKLTSVQTESLPANGKAVYAIGPDRSVADIKAKYLYEQNGHLQEAYTNSTVAQILALQNA